MYRITEINDIMYNIYSFRFKIIVIINVWSLFSTSHTNPHRHTYTALPSVLFVCLYMPFTKPGFTVKNGSRDVTTASE